MKPWQYKICDKCGKTYFRSNRVRLWVANNFGHRFGWVKAEQKICCNCMKAAEAQEAMLDINPKWKPLKSQEKVAGFTGRKHEKEAEGKGKAK